MLTRGLTAAALTPRSQVLGHHAVRRTNLIDEAGLANIRVSTQKQGPCIRVNGRQTGQMLTHYEKFTVNVLNFIRKLKKLKAEDLLDLAAHSRTVVTLPSLQHLSCT